MLYPKYAANNISGTSLKATSVTIHLSITRKPVKLLKYHQLPKCMAPIGQFHRSLKEFNKKLIAVTSCLDAVVASINVLCAMVN